MTRPTQPSKRFEYSIAIMEGQLHSLAIRIKLEKEYDHRCCDTLLKRFQAREVDIKDAVDALKRIRSNDAESL